jgi:hypothetical protein
LRSGGAGHRRNGSLRRGRRFARLFGFAIAPYIKTQHGFGVFVIHRRGLTPDGVMNFRKLRQGFELFRQLGWFNVDGEFLADFFGQIINSHALAPVRAWYTNAYGLTDSIKY